MLYKNVEHLLVFAAFTVEFLDIAFDVRNARAARHSCDANVTLDVIIIIALKKGACG